ncbi:MAG: acyl-CoA dehydrogenase family protein, partial [Burkholderiales bacterium]
MNFDYNEEQRLLADSVRRFMQKDYEFEARRKIVACAEGYSEKVWSTFAEMGLTGIPFSPDYGGFGGGAIDLMSVMEAFGEGLVVEPYLATLLGAQCVARAGSDAQKKALLPQVVEGKLKMAFAFSEKDARYDLAPAAVTAKKAGGGWALDGAKVVVLGAAAAGKIVVSAQAPAGPSLFLVEAKGVRMQPYRTLDEMRAADIVLSGAAGELLGSEGRALAVIDEVVD